MILAKVDFPETGSLEVTSKQPYCAQAFCISLKNILQDSLKCEIWWTNEFFQGLPNPHKKPGDWNYFSLLFFASSPAFPVSSVPAGPREHAQPLKIGAMKAACPPIVLIGKWYRFMDKATVNQEISKGRKHLQNSLSGE